MLFYAAFEIIKGAINKLLGEKPSDELIDNIKQIINELFDDNYSPHHFHIHNYVNNQELTFHIKVKNTMSVLDAHAIATKIENKIKDLMSITSTIHIEPKGFTHEAD